jgi:hypothetical protein
MADQELDTAEQVLDDGCGAELGDRISITYRRYATTQRRAARYTSARWCNSTTASMIRLPSKALMKSGIVSADAERTVVLFKEFCQFMKEPSEAMEHNAIGIRCAPHSRCLDHTLFWRWC